MRNIFVLKSVCSNLPVTSFLFLRRTGDSEMFTLIVNFKSHFLIKLAQKSFNFIAAKFLHGVTYAAGMSNNTNYFLL